MPGLARCLEPQVAVNHFAVTSNQARLLEAKFQILPQMSSTALSFLCGLRA
jgi:hypothetical protein